MRYKSPILFMSLLIAMHLQAQIQDPSIGAPVHLPDGYLEKVYKQSSGLDDQLTTQSAKYLKQVASEEEKLKKKLQKADSASAARLFGNVGERYQQLQSRLLHQGGGTATATTVEAYSPALDTLKNTLLFLQKNKAMLAGNSGLNDGQLSATLGKVMSLQDRVNGATALKSWIDQRQQYLKEQLSQFGMVKDLQGMNQRVYYYKQQLSDLKTSFKDPSKMSRTAMTALAQLPAYKSFIRQHSFLTSLFGQPEEYQLSDSSQQGLQTRAMVQKMIQEKAGIGGAGAAQQVAQQVQQAGDELSVLKSKLPPLHESEDPQDLGFTPNTQKTRSLWKRIEYGANLQFEPSGRLLPAICDIALSLGYRLSDNGTIGVGAAYKMGLGDGIDHIQLSSQGLGLRSYIDWKLKKSLYLSGGYEQNYLSAFRSIDQLRTASDWQKSGLIGLSRKYKISNKLSGKVQLLFDFLSYSQAPKSQPILFRAGWAF